MSTRSLSVMSPVVPVRPEDLAPVARQIAGSARLGRLWQGQGYGLDPVAAAAYLAGRGLGVPTGFGVVTTPRRHPHDAALAAHTVATLTGHPTVYGVGPGSSFVQRLLTGAAIDRPAQHVVDYLLGVKATLGQVDDADRAHPRWQHVVGPAATDPLRHLERPRVELGVGVLRAGMARVAGQVADAAITWLTPPAYLRSHIVPALTAGAQKAGRRRPRVVAIVPVALRRPGRDPVLLCRTSTAGHLALEHYADMARTSGVDLSDDAARTARSLVEHRVFLHGDADHVARDVDAYFAAGVDEVVLHVGSTADHHGPDSALSDVAELAELAA